MPRSDEITAASPPHVTRPSSAASSSTVPVRVCYNRRTSTGGETPPALAGGTPAIPLPIKILRDNEKSPPILRRSLADDPIVQRFRTLPFHGGNTGSNPVRVAISAFVPPEYAKASDSTLNVQKIIFAPR